MTTKFYRLCLVGILFFAMVGGVVYYLNHVKNKTSFTDGTLVKYDEAEDEEELLEKEWAA